MTQLSMSTSSVKCDNDTHTGPPSFKVEVGADRSTNSGLREGGWLVSRDGRRHYCPDCRTKKAKDN